MRSYLLPSDIPYDYQLLLDRLKGRYRFPRNKIQSLCRSGEIIPVKKGLYISGSPPGEALRVDPLVLSGLIYGPSYVSRETALAHHGLIPERVDEITCVTSKRSKLFRTPVGRFSYTPVPEEVFPLGVTLEKARGGTWLLAEPEKALCDRIAQVTGLRAMRDVSTLLRDDLRVEPEAVCGFRLSLVREIARRYRKMNVTVFANWLEKQHSPAAATS